MTETGVRHICRGVYGGQGAFSRPEPPARSENPVHGQILRLRAIHAKYLDQGYTRALIPPACVHLDVTEPPLHSHPYGKDAPRPHPELFAAFVGSAPGSPARLEEAIHDFYTAIGAPARPLHLDRLARSGPPPLPPRAAAMLRTLACGAKVASPDCRAVGYSVTADAVRLRVGRAGEALDRKAVVELQAALTAWLRLNQPPTP
ncbi:hypothetical protein [Streptomyces flavidovirens]|uniref:Uncharacterized protein n=1 Tax=Streptomyces flavidovirens TaxID=67298 RepID=A0ABW6R8L1_9ACTN